MTRYEALRVIIRENRYKRIAEVGVREGETLQFIVDSCDIDDYLGVDIELPMKLHEWIVAHPKARFIMEDSVHASYLVPDGSLDLVFIDADHSYEAVKADIAAWLPKVRAGGVLCGHDLSDAHSGVRQAVEERFGKNYEQLTDCVMWIVRIPCS